MSTKRAWFVVAMAVGLGSAACGSTSPSAGDGTDDGGTGGTSSGTGGTSSGTGGTSSGTGGTSGGTGGSAGTPTPTGFLGSCAVTVSGFTTCSDLSDCSSNIQQGCEGSGGTYSSMHCSTTDVIGLCMQAATASQCGTLSYFTSQGGLLTVAATKSACTSLKGTWSAP